MKIISISGLDGSGKSTQTKILKDYFLSTQKKVADFHAVSFSLANQLFSQKPADGSKSKAITQAKPLAIFARKIFLIIDLIRFKSFLSKLKRDSHDALLTDRYFFDQIVNIFYLEKTGINKNSWWFKLANKIIIKPDYCFYLKVSPESILSRGSEIEQGMEYLVAKERLYEEMAEIWQMKTIDGTKEISQVNQALLENIQQNKN